MTGPRHPERTLTLSAPLLSAMACTGILGCAALLIGTLLGPVFVPNYNSVSDTISDLAAGEGEIIMDVALYGFAAGLFALAIGTAHAHMGGRGWTTGIISLALLAALIVIVGARNEYGDNDNEGIVIHVYLVYGLGLLFAAMPLGFAARIDRMLPWGRQALVITGIGWAVLSPVFFFLPTTMDGLYERLLGGIACASLLTLSIALRTFAKAVRDTDPEGQPPRRASDSARP